MDTTISKIARVVIEELDRQSFAKDGMVFLASTTDLGPGAGIAPTGKYAGFIAGGSGVTIDSASFINPEKYAGDITDMNLSSGQFYPMELTTITISAGDIILIKKA